LFIEDDAPVVAVKPEQTAPVKTLEPVRVAPTRIAPTPM